MFHNYILPGKFLFFVRIVQQAVPTSKRKWDKTRFLKVPSQGILEFIVVGFHVIHLGGTRLSANTGELIGTQTRLGFLNGDQG
jgi:hypothetical protein